DQAHEAPAAAAPPPAERADAVAPARESRTERAAPVLQAAPTQALGNVAAPGSREVSKEASGKERAESDAATAGRTPEEWYAEIEALRAAGRDVEADAELAKLEEAYPGWLAQR